MDNFTIQQLDKALKEKDDAKFRMHIELLRDMLASTQQINAPMTQYKPPLARSNVKDGQVINSQYKTQPEGSTQATDALSLVGEDFSLDALNGPSPAIEALNKKVGGKLNGTKKK